ncbi:hypothetical protein CRUP_008720 [Coryphaenoides rupestris]|nr:hypothetical protein CRUP_008720 [Coryphaenoides rupestris]
MAAEHGELLGEMSTVGRLSATERLKHAQKRRAQQLKGWAQMEKDAATRGSRASKADNNTKKKKKKEGEGSSGPSGTRRVTFPDTCCIDDFTEMVQCLLDAGARVNACDSELWTPLHAAATCGHTELVQLLALVESKADLDAQDVSGATVLHIVSANGYLLVAELLLENKAQLEVKDLDGWTPLHAAACWGQTCARTRRKLVRRVSVNERSSLYRREHHKEAMVWQGRGRQPDAHDDDEDKQTDNELHQHAAMPEGEEPPSGQENGDEAVSPAASVPSEPWVGGAGKSRSASYQLSPAPATPTTGGPPDAGVGVAMVASAAVGANGMTREKSHQTLADLKRQRAAAKLNKYPAPTPPLPPPVVEEEEPPSEGGGGGDDEGAPPGGGEGEVPPRDQTTSVAVGVSTMSSQVYFTPASGDPPLLKLRAPEEEQSTVKEPCCRLM